MSCVVTAQLIGAFVYAYAKIRVSHDEAQEIKYEFIQVCQMLVISNLQASKINTIFRSIFKRKK